MARPKRPGRALRAYALLAVLLAAVAGLHSTGFTAQRPNHRVRVRLAALKPGDAVQLRDEGGAWYDAVVDSEDANGRIKAHFLTDDHEVHLLPTMWRVPRRKVAPVTQELNESSLQNGQKLKGKVVGRRSNGLLVDAGLSTARLVHPSHAPLSDLKEGQEVDVWVRRGPGGQAALSLVNVWKHTGLVGEWMNTNVTSVGPNLVFVRGQTADGDCLPGILPMSEMAPYGVKPAVGDTLRLRLMSIDRELGSCLFSMLPSVDDFAGVSSNEWLHATAWRGEQPNFGFHVEVPHPSTQQLRRVLLHNSEIPEYLKLLSNSSFGPGAAVRVRIIRIDPAAQLIHISMLPVLGDFENIPQEQWLRGRVEHVVPEHGYAVRVENPTGGDDVVGWLPKGLVRYGFTPELQAEVGQEVNVRIHQAKAGKLLLSMRDPDAIAAFGNVSEDTWMSAKVTELSPEGLNVNVVPPHGGPAHEGAVWREDIRQGIVTDATEEEVEVGDTLNVRLIRSALGDGNLDFSLKPKSDLSAFEALPATEWLKGTVIEVRDERVALVVSSPVRGGRAVEGHLRLEEQGEVNMGQQLEVRVATVNARRDRLMLSAKPSKSVSIFKDTPPTQWFNGTVVNVVKFGIFVQLEVPRTAVSGLVHISQISTDRVKDNSELPGKGEVVRVRVVSVDTEKDDMALSMLPVLETA